MRKNARLGSVIQQVKNVRGGMVSENSLLLKNLRDNNGHINAFGINVTPLGQSVISMGLSMALQFSGYEFARNSCLALFTSDETGFTSPSAYPMAMAFITPASYLLLLAYERVLASRGPRIALRYSMVSCALAMFVLGFSIFATEGNERSISISLLRKYLVLVAFVFQNCYTHFISTQHWSFVGSVLTPDQGATWFACLSGVTSLTASIAGSSVSTAVSRLGLSRTLAIFTSFFLLLSLFFAEYSYSISEKYSFCPSRGKESTKSKDLDVKDQHASLFKKATDLFYRVPNLKLLFYEVISFQSMTMILNMCFVKTLKSAKSNDLDRAGWTGKFYALVNVISAFLQFVAVPLIMKFIEPGTLCRVIPVIMVALTSFQCMNRESNLSLASASFLVAKVIDYSFRGVINELIYIPLDFESRFLGKEVIGMLGNRMGKASISLVLAFSSFNLVSLTRLAAASSFSWLALSNRLSHAVPKIVRGVTKKSKDT